MFVKQVINEVEIIIEEINFLQLVKAGNLVNQNKGEFIIYLCSFAVSLNGHKYNYEWWCQYNDIEVLAFVMEAIGTQTRSLNF